MSNTKFYQLILILLLVPALIIIHYNAENHISAMLWLVGLILVFWIFRIISGGIKKLQIKRIMERNEKISARIISVKEYKNRWVLQLSIQGKNAPYIASYVEFNPDNYQKENFKPGHNLQGYVNPRDQYEFIIPSPKKRSTSRSTSNFGGIFWAIFIILSIGAPLIIHVFDPANKIFKEVTYMVDADGNGRILELRFEPSKKIHLRVIDPIRDKIIKKIKEKKENELDYYLNFSICLQNQNMVILGLGNTPVFDVYNTNTFEKISDIKKFEQLDKKLSSGIVKMEKENVNSKFFKDNFVKIVTTDGSTSYYNIEKNLFFYTEKELRNFIEKTDKDILAEHLNVFALSPVSGSNYQAQVYVISSEKTNKLDELLRQAGSTSFNPKRFEKEKRFNCKKCNARMLTDEKFLEAQIVYYDTSMVVINSLVSMKKDDYNKITAFDKTGKLLFSVHGSEFPNSKLMDENGYRTHSSGDFKFIRIKNTLAIFFKEYGAIGINLNSGDILWKYEP